MSNDLNRVLSFGLIAFCAFGAVLCEDTQGLDSLEPLECLIGHWEGRLTLPEGHTFSVTIEFRWGAGRKTIHYQVLAGVGVERGLFAEGTYWRNPLSGQIEYREYAFGGTGSAGIIQSQGSDLVFTWTEYTSKGKNHYKDTLRFDSVDSWTSQPFQKTGEGWVEVMPPVTYQRIK